MSSSAVFVATAMYGWYATYKAFQKERQQEQNQDTADNVSDICQICHDQSATLACSDETNKHSFCTNCFDQYCKTCFQVGGSYGRRVEANNNDNAELVSVEGTLPCPFFQHEGCSCVAFSEQILRQFLSDEGFRQWQAAVCRMAVAEAERQERNHPPESQQQEDDDIVTHIGTAVAEALSLGSAMVCPRCNRRTVKDDDQCMHMKCGECNCEWCYCCGRENATEFPDRPRCTSCQYQHGIFLENHPPFAGHALTGESPGDGALYEFHRRRMAYFVGLIKLLVDEYDTELWDQFREANPTVLDNVPTLGRQIDWEALDDARPPLFGRTRERDLRPWMTHADPYMTTLRGRLDQHRQQHGHEEESKQEQPVRPDPEQVLPPREQGEVGLQEYPFVEDTELLEVLEQLLMQQEEGDDPDETFNELINDILGQMGLMPDPLAAPLHPDTEEELTNNTVVQDHETRGEPVSRHEGIRGAIRRLRNRRRRYRPVGYEV